MRLSRNSATFDLCDATIVLRGFEVFDKFTITSGEALIYSSLFTVKDLVNSGHRVVCEVKYMKPELAAPW